MSLLRDAAAFGNRALLNSFLSFIGHSRHYNSRPVYTEFARNLHLWYRKFNNNSLKPVFCSNSCKKIYSIDTNTVTPENSEQH